MTVLPDFRLETYMAKWEFAGRYHLTASDAQTMTIGEILALDGEGAVERFLAEPLHYTETYGNPDVRDAIAATFDRCAADDILCFAGAEEALYVFYKVLLDATSHCIVITPNYQSAETIPLSICATTGVALEEHEHWTLDIDKVAAAIRPDTRVIAINFPHNPTGKILERDRFDALINLCRTHGIYLFSDEVYRLIERDPSLRLPQVADVYERGVSLNVMSKVYGLPGLRVGWLGCQDRDLRERMVRYKHYLSICNSGPSERLTIVALRHRHVILERANHFARLGYAKFQAFLADFPDLFESYEGDGGLILYPRYKGSEGAEAFCTRAVTEAGIVLMPPSVYASDLTSSPNDRFRIGFGRADLDAGLAAFRAFLMDQGRDHG